MRQAMRTLCSFAFWLPIDAAINRFHGWSYRDTLFLYKLAWRIEREHNFSR